MPTVITRDNYLTLNSVPLSTPAWWITNLTSEMLSDSTVRGQDRIIPGALGVRSKLRRRTVTVKQFEMVIIGSLDMTGSAYSNINTGLITNVEYLKSNLGLASSSGTGLVTATWHRPDSSTKAASVHVERFETSDLVKRHVTAILELSIPAGVFA